MIICTCTPSFGFSDDRAGSLPSRAVHLILYAMKDNMDWILASTVSHTSSGGTEDKEATPSGTMRRMKYDRCFLQLWYHVVVFC